MPQDMALMEEIEQTKLRVMSLLMHKNFVYIII